LKREVFIGALCALLVFSWNSSY